MKTDALTATAQALAITSQLLAIGIEVGIVAGGFYIYKKLTTEQRTEELPAIRHVDDNMEAILIPEGYELVPAKGKKELSFKERWEKIGKIVKAVIG